MIRFAALGAVGLMLLAAVYALGRAHGSEACERRMAAVSEQAVDEKAADDARQAESGRGDRRAMEIENARLRRILNERSAPHAESGRHCLEPRDADGLRDDYHAIFGARLQAGPGPDDTE